MSASIDLAGDHWILVAGDAEEIAADIARLLVDGDPFYRCVLAEAERTVWIAVRHVRAVRALA